MGSINKFLVDKNQNESTIFDITLIEMEKIVPVKAVVLGLVHLKRLDIGSADGVKVYKVKK